MEDNDSSYHKTMKEMDEEILILHERNEAARQLNEEIIK